MTRLSRLAAILLALLPLLVRAQADPAPPPPEPVPPDVQQLYESALQSIADGRKNDARDALNKVVDQEAQHAGAWLDLALIQCALGYAAEAERLFAHIERHFDPPPSISALIDEARQGGCAQWKPLSQGTLSVGRGLSQNVNQGARASAGLPDAALDDEFLPRHDQFLTLTGDYVRDLTANGTTGFVQFQGRRHDSLRQYDSASLFVGAETPWRFGLWTVRGSAMLGLVTLGSHLYQQQSQLQLRVETPWRLPGGVRFTMSTGYSDARYRTLANFDAGTAELRGQFSWRNPDHYVTASLGRQDDHARSTRPGGDRSGWMATASWRTRLPAEVIGELGYSQQRWRGEQDYLPGLIDITRRQLTHAWRGSLNYPLGDKQALVLEGRLIRNKENIPFFQYNDRQVQLSWQWQWP